MQRARGASEMRAFVPRSIPSVALVLAILPLGCAPEGRVEQRLATCGFLSEGEIGPRITAPFYQPNDCYRACLGGATCEELESLLCGTTIDLFLRCDAQCAYRCDDGALIGVEDVCNGFMECAGGEDERGCPGVTCADGSTVPGERCNGRGECPDLSDEEGCPTCEAVWGGNLFLVHAGLCDGYLACLDGADERGCPEHRCDDGTIVTHREGAPVRCDGRVQCPDGSDEAECAGFVFECD